MDNKKVRTTFRFTLPKGLGIKAEPGRKVTGVMRLIQVKDLVEIERAGVLAAETGNFYLILLSRTVTELGQEMGVTRKTIEKLTPDDFTFLVDFLQEINHQVIKRVKLTCPSCKNEYNVSFSQLGGV